MKKNIIFFAILGLIIAAIYFLKRSKPEIKIGLEVQNRNCFCSSEENRPITACFDPQNMDFAIWNTQSDLSMVPFRVPFKWGKWAKTSKEIQITYLDESGLKIPHQSKKIDEYPTSILTGDIYLKPEFCKDLNWKNLGQRIQNTKDSVFLCADANNQNIPNIGVLFNFKEGVFKQWDEINLYSQESVILESPALSGELKINGDLIYLKASDGKEINGEITIRENGIPSIIELSRENIVFEVKRDNCLWMIQSFRDIPLIKSKNVLCEKSKKDFIIDVMPEEKRIKVYSDVEKFSMKDFFEDKFTYQLTEISINEDELVFVTSAGKVRGKVKKDGERIVMIQIPNKDIQSELEFSREYCPPFFLTDKLWK